MDFGLTPEAIRNGFILYILLIVCLCLRAYGQAWLANRLGDPTPQNEGRLTLNPLSHLDLIGSVILPLVCIFYLQPRSPSFNFFLAWAKPVPINPGNFDNPNRDYLLTQLANPAMSLVLALLSAFVGALAFRCSPDSGEVFGTLIVINASLFVIDLLPIPPLPGGLILRQLGLISEETFAQIARWGGLALIIAFNLPPVRAVLGGLIQLVATPFLLIFQALIR